ncbi:MAG: methyltransferase domain-containing protein [Anaerolineales bacterium]|jgi:ubiquinone/menaquinone biosynthesis C-methylase UbiE|nr:methyltransferase domain-containing protein [Anaerolineales bacterium]
MRGQLAPELLSKSLRFFFQLLYHQFAWAYDLVAYTVSLGQWSEWISAAYSRLDVQPVLEVGFGTGQLQFDLTQKGFAVYGIDESRQMARLTRQKLVRGGLEPRILRGVAQNLPFPANSFGCVVSTFPAEYIFDLETIREIQRVLLPGGKAVICPVAWITGKTIPQRLAAGLFRVTHESPPMQELLAGPLQAYSERLADLGFKVSYEVVESNSSKMLLITAQKSAPA